MSETLPSPIVEALNVGRAQPFRGSEMSAFVKTPVDGPVAITRLGLAGDEQVENAHGGPDMAVHIYPQDHGPFWRERIGHHPYLDLPGAFGTNLTLHGLDETRLRIGDRFTLGTAQLEISQPRKPCWKIEHRFGQKGMVAAILQTGRCGWYCRVVEEGSAQAGDPLIPIERGMARFTVARIFATLWGTEGGEVLDLAELAELPSLSEELRDTARKRLDR